ncbi:MAG TPA: hypothetical protein VIH06_07735, partial [Ilumatobacteraceae bacterium]
MPGHPGGQLPQFAGEIHHDGQHEQWQRTAHQGAQRADLHQRIPERPQRDGSEAEIGQPYRQQRDEREPEDLGGGEPGETAVGERKPEHEERHHDKSGRAPARLAQGRAALVQQIQRDGRGHQQQGEHPEPDRIAVVGVAAGQLGQHHRQRDDRADAADHRCRPLDQRARTHPTGQHQRQPAMQEPLIHLAHIRHGKHCARRWRNCSANDGLVPMRRLP